MNNTEVTTIYEVNGKTFESKKEFNAYIKAYKLINDVTEVPYKVTKTVHSVKTFEAIA